MFFAEKQQEKINEIVEKTKECILEANFSNFKPVCINFESIAFFRNPSSPDDYQNLKGDKLYLRWRSFDQVLNCILIGLLGTSKQVREDGQVM